MALTLFSDRAWKIASLYSSFLASETRDLAEHIDRAIEEVIEEAASVAEQRGARDAANEIRVMHRGKKFRNESD